jgi:hypothetical protein
MRPRRTLEHPLAYSFSLGQEKLSVRIAELRYSVGECADS